MLSIVELFDFVSRRGEKGEVNVFPINQPNRRMGSLIGFDPLFSILPIISLS